MNKYLEKIASISTVAKTVAKSTVGAAADAVKGVGNQLHLATGGAYKDYAISKGVTSPHILSNVKAGPGARRELTKALRKSPELKEKMVKTKLTDGPAARESARKQNRNIYKEHVKKFYGRNNEFQKLQEKTRRARINVAAIGGGSYYVGSKIKNKADEIKTRNSVQYVY